MKPWLDPSLPPLPALDESELVQIGIYRKMTPFEKWQQAAAMREMARKVRVAMLKRSHPEWTEAEIEASALEFMVRAST